jgi:hypothetical protein
MSFFYFHKESSQAIRKTEIVEVVVKKYEPYYSFCAVNQKGIEEEKKRLEEWKKTPWGVAIRLKDRTLSYVYEFATEEEAVIKLKSILNEIDSK